MRRNIPVYYKGDYAFGTDVPESAADWAKLRARMAARTGISVSNQEWGARDFGSGIVPLLKGDPMPGRYTYLSLAAPWTLTLDSSTMPQWMRVTDNKSGAGTLSPRCGRWDGDTIESAAEHVQAAYGTKDEIAFWVPLNNWSPPPGVTRIPVRYAQITSLPPPAHCGRKVLIVSVTAGVSVVVCAAKRTEVMYSATVSPGTLVRCVASDAERALGLPRGYLKHPRIMQHAANGTVEYSQVLDYAHDNMGCTIVVDCD